jgi:hypothetical protein
VLADFFGVDVGYFSTAQVATEGGTPGLDDDLRRALAQPLIREMARRASGLTEAEQEIVLQMIENANKLAAQILQRERQQEAAPRDTSGEPQA